MSQEVSENGVVSLEILLPETTVIDGRSVSSIHLNTWKSYSFNSHFLTPTDGWSFTVSDDTVDDLFRHFVAPRTRVVLRIGNRVQGNGYIDKVTCTASRQSGTEFTIEGRDILSPTVDSVIDPRIQFQETDTLLEFVKKVFGPFGWGDEASFVLDNSDNLALMTGHAHGKKTTAKGKPLKSYVLHKLKPYDHEGAFAFAARVLQRFGLWVHPSADGTFLVVSTPAFQQQEIAFFARNKVGIFSKENTVLSATVTRDTGGIQASAILASGFGSGGQNPREQFTLGVVNPVILTDLSSVFAAYSKTRFIDLSYLGPGYSGGTRESGFTTTGPTGASFFDKYARPLFLHDANSKTQDELENFVKRELALRMHKAFTYTFEVEGHEYVAEDGTRTPWVTDDIVDVDDDVCNVHEPLWILSRTFTKSRTGGTRTKIECIRPHTLVF